MDARIRERRGSRPSGPVLHHPQYAPARRKTKTAPTFVGAVSEIRGASSPSSPSSLPSSSLPYDIYIFEWLSSTRPARLVRRCVYEFNYCTHVREQCDKYTFMWITFFQSRAKFFKTFSETISIRVHAAAEFIATTRATSTNVYRTDRLNMQKDALRRTGASSKVESLM